MPFQKGHEKISGRQAGTPNKIKLPPLEMSEDIAAAIDTILPAAVKTIYELLTSENENIRLKAAQIFIDKRIGTMQSIKLDSPLTTTQVIISDE
jgi:hypothetical protein